MIRFNLNLLFLLLFAMGQLHAQNLQKAWETDTLLSRPESAVYDPNTQLIYVSNINGKYFTEDGNGFLSKIDLNGQIVEQKWIDGLNAPQGLVMTNGHLYVADVDNIVEIDPETGVVVTRYPVEDALFLNDAAADAHGNVFVSECRNNKVYMLSKGDVSVFLNDTLLKGTNGLLCTDSVCLVISGKIEKIYRFNPENKVLHEFSNGIKNGDGIAIDGDGGFFVSGAWQGELYHLDSEGKKQLVLDLGKQKIIVADICYIPEKHLLLVPTLNKTLLAYNWIKK